MKILDYKSKTFFQDLLQATSQAASGIDTGKIAADVIAQVRQNGDAAVAELTEKFDGVKIKPENFAVSKSEFAAALKRSRRRQKNDERGRKMREVFQRKIKAQKLAR